MVVESESDMPRRWSRRLPMDKGDEREKARERPFVAWQRNKRKCQKYVQRSEGPRATRGAQQDGRGGSRKNCQSSASPPRRCWNERRTMGLPREDWITKGGSSDPAPWVEFILASASRPLGRDGRSRVRSPRRCGPCPSAVTVREGAAGGWTSGTGPSASRGSSSSF